MESKYLDSSPSCQNGINNHFSMHLRTHDIDFLSIKEQVCIINLLYVNKMCLLIYFYNALEVQKRFRPIYMFNESHTHTNSLTLSSFASHKRVILGLVVYTLEALYNPHQALTSVDNIGHHDGTNLNWPNVTYNTLYP
jgi:hypothetical protein